jgi:hypothetical protein
MSGVDENASAMDFAAQSTPRILASNGNLTYNYDGLVPYVALDGTGDFLSRPDEAGLDIIGTETYVAAAVRGLTFGGWFYVTTFGALDGYIGKTAPAPFPNLSYAIFQNGATPAVPRFEVYVAAATTIDSSVTMVVDTWYFIVGRYTPSTSLSIFVNDTRDDQLAAVPAAINNSGSPFEIGRFIAANYLAGRASMCFLCAASLSNSIINALYQSTRGMFGV